MGANCYQCVAAAPFGGNSAHFNLRSYPQAPNNRSSFHLFSPVSNSVSINQASLIKNGSSWVGRNGFDGMHLPEGAPIGMSSAHSAGYHAGWNGPTRSSLVCWLEWDPGGPVRSGGSDQVAGRPTGITSG